MKKKIAKNYRPLFLLIWLYYQYNKNMNNTLIKEEELNPGLNYAVPTQWFYINAIKQLDPTRQKFSRINFRCLAQNVAIFREYNLKNQSNKVKEISRWLKTKFQRIYFSPKMLPGATYGADYKLLNPKYWQLISNKIDKEYPGVQFRLALFLTDQYDLNRGEIVQSINQTLVCPKPTKKVYLVNPIYYQTQDISNLHIVYAPRNMDFVDFIIQYFRYSYNDLSELVVSISGSEYQSLGDFIGLKMLDLENNLPLILVDFQKNSQLNQSDQIIDSSDMDLETFNAQNQMWVKTLKKTKNNPQIEQTAFSCEQDQLPKKKIPHKFEEVLNYAYPQAKQKYSANQIQSMKIKENYILKGSVIDIPKVEIQTEQVYRIELQAIAADLVAIAAKRKNTVK